MKLVIVSPHRDDAAFSLGLAVTSWLRAGHRVQILNCFTRSDYAPYSDADSLHANDRVSFVSAIRKREDAAWNKRLGGRLQFTDLDLLDAPLRLACPVEEAFTASLRPGDRAVARVAGAIAKMARASADLGFLLPLAVGGHIDHRVVRAAGLEALTGSALPVAFYEDLPYAVCPEFAGDVEESARTTELALRPVPAGPREELDSAVSQKRRVAECYDSQIDSDVAGQIAGFCRHYDGRERLWANPAWCNSRLLTDLEV